MYCIVVHMPYVAIYIGLLPYVAIDVLCCSAYTIRYTTLPYVATYLFLRNPGMTQCVMIYRDTGLSYQRAVVGMGLWAMRWLVWALCAL